MVPMAPSQTSNCPPRSVLYPLCLVTPFILLWPILQSAAHDRKFSSEKFNPAKRFFLICISYSKHIILYKTYVIITNFMMRKIYTDLYRTTMWINILPISENSYFQSYTNSLDYCLTIEMCQMDNRRKYGTDSPTVPTYRLNCNDLWMT